MVELHRLIFEGPWRCIGMENDELPRPFANRFGAIALVTERSPEERSRLKGVTFEKMVGQVDSIERERLVLDSCMRYLRGH